MFEDKREREITFPSCEKVFLYLLNVIVIITIMQNRFKIRCGITHMEKEYVISRACCIH